MYAASNVTQVNRSNIRRQQQLMAGSVALPQSQAQSQQPGLQFLRVIPGVLLLAGVGYAGKLLEKNVSAYAKPITGRFPTLNTYSGRF
jgi:hypothetical protein